jgi:hypothetical protein
MPVISTVYLYSVLCRKKPRQMGKDPASPRDGNTADRLSRRGVQCPYMYIITEYTLSIFVGLDQSKVRERREGRRGNPHRRNETFFFFSFSLLARSRGRRWALCGAIVTFRLFARLSPRGGVDYIHISTTLYSHTSPMVEAVGKGR